MKFHRHTHTRHEKPNLSHSTGISRSITHRFISKQVQYCTVSIVRFITNQGSGIDTRESTKIENLELRTHAKKNDVHFKINISFVIKIELCLMCWNS